ncbi:MAG: methylenetetrahydrofolate reductase [NAD(P)H] [Gammaproteobacteria bacterium]|jgi:methylenetetrahydrofolate reductase (NADPH)|nr:methylenetetrahydrofolate reductase [NAD(P)H] [Gammaproteobacteria bacterium]MCH1551598.1 methylenetetrahydrofolate reductase [NAD(P)H] [Pseudomonadales bacterium]
MNATTTAPSLSFEFFPPRDVPGQKRLIENVAGKLGALEPSFFSVTYGAGGTTRDGTRQTVYRLIDAGFNAVPHLSMGADDKTHIQTILDDYCSRGVKRIVVLRGDQPSGFGANRFTHNAEALVNLIRTHCGDQFHLEVAAYPEIHPDASSAEQDLEFFKRKIDAGADSAITQYFYNADAYENFLERCAKAGITAPIVPGIMPITNLASLMRFSQKCGADIPRWLNNVLTDTADDQQATIDFGVDFVSRLCERLLQLGAPGLHFYTLNRWGATTRICQNLALH